MAQQTQEQIQLQRASDRVFKHAARREALIYAKALAENQVSNYDSELLLEEADKVYNWIVNIIDEN